MVSEHARLAGYYAGMAIGQRPGPLRAQWMRKCAWHTRRAGLGFMVPHAQLMRVARGLCIRPGRSGLRLKKERGRWWIVGGEMGDVILPDSRLANTPEQALAFAERWLRAAPEVDGGH